MYCKINFTINLISCVFKINFKPHLCITSFIFQQVIKPVNLEALSKWVGQMPDDVVQVTLESKLLIFRKQDLVV